MGFGQIGYRNACRFCGGKGCFDCDVKGDRAREESFSNPLTFSTESPEDMERLRSILGAKVLSRDEAFEVAKSELIAALRKHQGEDNA